MTIAIGRAGRDTGLTLNSPTYWSVSGDEVDLVGALTASSLAKLVILRAQVNGLADNRDEPVVAVNWAGDVTVDGFYEVLDAQVPMPARGLAALKLDYRLRLRNLGAYPQIESRLLGALRTNSHSIVVGSTVPWWATPTDATMDHVSGTSTATRTGDGGSIKVAYTTNGTLLYDATPTWQCDASDYYDGAAKVEVTDGSSWYTWVGRNIPGATLLAWRINNGLVRVTYGGGAGLFTVQHYAGGSWITAKTYRIFDTTGAVAGVAISGTPQTVTVLRNSPECVSIRIGWEFVAGYPAPIYLDLTLRRGSLWVDGALVITDGFVGLLNSIGPVHLGIGRDTAEAAATHTSGLHANAADAAGGKYVMSTPVAKGNDTTQGAFWPTTNAPVFPFMIGYEPASAAGPDTITNQVYAYFAATTESQRLVRR